MDEQRFEVRRDDGEIVEYMVFTPHPMTPRMVWRRRARFGKEWPRAMWQALRGRGPWTENLTDHEVEQVESYLKDKWEV